MTKINSPIGKFDANVDYPVTVVAGGASYENVVDAWKVITKGKRMLKVLTYITALAASASYTSNTITAQDSNGNNYTEIRLSLYQTGSTNTTAKIQQSDDGVNWYDIPNQSVTLTADGVAVLDAEVYLDFIRIVESNNDATNAQTANKLVAYLL